MCDVCCATDAIEQTKKGKAAVFRWDPEDALVKRRRGKGLTHVLLANNPHAPPVGGVVAPVPAGWPSLMVQAKVVRKAEGMDDNPEGPGSIRLRYTARQKWSPWMAVHDIASAMLYLGVDMRWGMLTEPWQALHRAKNTRATTAAFQIAEARGVAFNEGHKAASRCRRGAKLLLARLDVVVKALLEGCAARAEAIPPRVEGFLMGLRKPFRVVRASRGRKRKRA